MPDTKCAGVTSNAGFRPGLPGEVVLTLASVPVIGEVIKDSTMSWRRCVSTRTVETSTHTVRDENVPQCSFLCASPVELHLLVKNTRGHADTLSTHRCLTCQSSIALLPPPVPRFQRRHR